MPYLYDKPTLSKVVPETPNETLAMFAADIRTTEWRTSSGVEPRSES